MIDRLHRVNAFSCILHVAEGKNSDASASSINFRHCNPAVGGSNLAEGFRCSRWCSWQTKTKVSIIVNTAPSKCQGLPRLPTSGEMSSSSRSWLKILISDGKSQWGAVWVRPGRTRGKGDLKPRLNAEVCHPEAECTSCVSCARRWVDWLDWPAVGEETDWLTSTTTAGYWTYCLAKKIFSLIGYLSYIKLY